MSSACVKTTTTSPDSPAAAARVPAISKHRSARASSPARIQCRASAESARGEHERASEPERVRSSPRSSSSRSSTPTPIRDANAAAAAACAGRRAASGSIPYATRRSASSANAKDSPPSPRRRVSIPSRTSSAAEEALPVRSSPRRLPSPSPSSSPSSSSSASTAARKSSSSNVGPRVAAREAARLAGGDNACMIARRASSSLDAAKKSFSFSRAGVFLARVGPTSDASSSEMCLNTRVRPRFPLSRRPSPSSNAARPAHALAVVSHTSVPSFDSCAASLAATLTASPYNAYSHLDLAPTHPQNVSPVTTPAREFKPARRMFRRARVAASSARHGSSSCAAPGSPNANTAVVPFSSTRN